MKNVSKASLVLLCLSCSVAQANPEHPKRSKNAKPLFWLESDIDTSFYKGPHPLKKSSPGRGRWAWPILDKRLLNRSVHSTVFRRSDVTGTRRTFGEGANISVKTSPYVTITSRYQWKVTPETSGAVNNLTGTQDSISSTGFRVTEESSPNTLSHRVTLVQVKNPDLPSVIASMKINWHMKGEIETSVAKNYPNGKETVQRYFGTRDTTITVFNGNNQSPQSSIRVDTPQYFEITSKLKAAPEIYHDLYDAASLFFGSGGDAVSAKIEGPASGAISSAVSAAGKFIEPFEPQDVDVKISSGLQELFVRSARSDKYNKSSGSPPYGKTQKPLFITFSAPFDSPTMKQRVLDHPENFSGSFVLYSKIGVGRSYKRLAQTGKKFDRHGYIGQYRVTVDKPVNNNSSGLIHYGFFSAAPPAS